MKAQPTKPEKPYPPNETEYDDDYEEKILHRITYVYTDVDLGCLIDNYYSEESDSEEDPEVIKKRLNIQNWGYQNRIFSVKELLQIIPKGADLSKIEIRTNRDRQMDHIEIQVVQRIPIDKKAQKAAYKKAYSVYKEKETQYKRDLALYEEAARKAKIDMCKKRIKKLQGE